MDRDTANLTKTDYSFREVLTVLQKEHPDKEKMRTVLNDSETHLGSDDGKRERLNLRGFLEKANRLLGR